MQKKIIALSFFLLLFTIPLFSQNKVKEVSEPEGGFSYLIPHEWTIDKIEGMPYQIARDKAVNGFHPNINVHQEKNNFTFSEYVKANIADIKKNEIDYLEITTEDFTTTAGLKGKKHSCANKQFGKSLFHTYYFFETVKKYKFIITGTCLIEDKYKYSPVFDVIAKSFKTVK